MDATGSRLAMIRDLNRRDLNAIMLSGCVIAWFNIIDPKRIFDDTGIPVIGVSYEEPSGLNEEIRTHFLGRYDPSCDLSEPEGEEPGCDAYGRDTVSSLMGAFRTGCITAL